MWELNHKIRSAPKNWCFWTVVLEKTLESPLECKEIQPVHPKGDQPWVFIGRTDAEAETPILWPPDGKNWLIGKDLTYWKRPNSLKKTLMLGKIEGRRRRGRQRMRWLDGITDSMDWTELSVKESTYQRRRHKRSWFYPWVRFSGGGKGNPLQYSCLDNPMDRGARRVRVCGVTKGQTWLRSCMCTCVCTHTQRNWYYFKSKMDVNLFSKHGWDRKLGWLNWWI